MRKGALLLLLVTRRELSIDSYPSSTKTQLKKEKSRCGPLLLLLRFLPALGGI